MISEREWNAVVRIANAGREGGSTQVLFVLFYQVLFVALVNAALLVITLFLIPHLLVLNLLSKSLITLFAPLVMLFIALNVLVVTCYMLVKLVDVSATVFATIFIIFAKATKLNQFLGILILINF